MSYTPHEWQDGETITAERMNALEEGVANAGGSDDPYAGYDLVIEASGENLSGSTFTIKKGDYASCFKKVTIGEPLDVFIYSLYQNEDSDYGGTGWRVLSYRADIGYHDCIEMTTFNNGYTGGGGTQGLFFTESGVSVSAP